METTTQTYLVRLYDEFTMMQVTRTLPTKPKTSKGIKAHNTRLENYAVKQYPNWKEIDVKLLP